MTVIDGVLVTGNHRTGEKKLRERRSVALTKEDGLVSGGVA